MTREEVIKAYEEKAPVLVDYYNRGKFTWHTYIHGYEVKHSEHGEDEEQFFVILLDEKTKNCTIHVKPERVILAKRM